VFSQSRPGEKETLLYSAGFRTPCLRARNVVTTPNLHPGSWEEWALDFYNNDDDDYDDDNNNNTLQLVCQPVTVVIIHVYKI